MRAVLLAVLVLELGCQKGEAGPPGPPGPAGEAGPTGPTGPASAPRLLWVDSSGRIASYAEEPVYLDADGHIWEVDPRTGKVSPTHDTVRLAYESGDCTGPALYIYFPLPRVVFTSEGSSEPRVVPDRPDIAVRLIGSYISASPDGGSYCDPLPAGSTLQRPSVLRTGTDLVQGTPPADFAPPLHREFGR